MARKKNTEKKDWGGFANLSADDQAKIYATIEGTYDTTREIENGKEELKEIFSDLNRETGIPKKLFNFLVKDCYYADGNQKIEENEEFREAKDLIEKLRNEHEKS